MLSNFIILGASRTGAAPHGIDTLPFAGQGSNSLN